MVFGFHHTRSALNAKIIEIRAQAGQRPLMQEAGEIVGAVWEQLATSDPDEEIEVLVLDPVGVRVGRRLGERGMRKPER